MARCKHCGEEDETGWCCIEKSIAIDEAREHLRDCAEAFCSAHKRSLDSCSMGRSAEWDKANSDREASWAAYKEASARLRELTKASEA